MPALSGGLPIMLPQAGLRSCLKNMLLPSHWEKRESSLWKEFVFFPPVGVFFYFYFLFFEWVCTRDSGERNWRDANMHFNNKKKNHHLSLEMSTLGSAHPNKPTRLVSVIMTSRRGPRLTVELSSHGRCQYVSLQLGTEVQSLPSQALEKSLSLNSNPFPTLNQMPILTSFLGLKSHIILLAQLSIWVSRKRENCSCTTYPQHLMQIVILRFTIIESESFPKQSHVET